MYTVVEVNQASMQPERCEWVFWDLADAREYATDMRAEAVQLGRKERYFVAELTEVED